MTLSELSIKKPVFAWMLMAAFVLFGWLCFDRMGVSQLPDVDMPVVSIRASLEGAAPEVMETSVVELIEDAVISIGGIEGMTSTANAGSASVSVEFGLDKDVDVAVQEIQSAVARIQSRLPRGMDPPTVSKQNPEDQPILWFSVRSDKMTERDLMIYVRDKIKDRFTTVRGVGEIQMGGYVDPALRIWVSGKQLDKYALSVNDVINTLQTEHSELPAGRIETNLKEWNVRTLGEASSVAEFNQIAIQRRGGAPNYVPLSLGQVSRVEEGLGDVRRRSRSMGKFSIGLGIKKQRGTNAVAVAQAVKARMKEVEKELPEGASLAINFDNTKFVEEAVHELNFTLVLSAILTALVCWAFLGSWSATFNIILAIPTSILGSFIILYMLGFTLNVFTLLALSLAIGIVVDDAIMVLENIVSRFEKTPDREEAAIKGSRQITFAAMAATAAIIAVFLPVAFMKGMIGKYFYQFGVTLSVAVAVSLVEALTFTPMRCAQFLSVGERSTRLGRLMDSGFDRLIAWYRSSLVTILRYRWATVLGSLVFFVATLAMAKLLKSEFMPAQDQGALMLRVRAPVGSSLEYTDKRFQEIEAYLQSRPEVERYFSSVGGFGGGDVDTGVIFLMLKPKDQRGRDPKTGEAVSQQQFATSLREESKRFQGMKLFVQDLSLGGFSGRRGYPVSFTVQGSDWETLTQLSEKIKDAMEKTGMVVDVDSDYRPGMPEYQVTPNREAARSRGVSIVDINQTIQAMLGGYIAGKYSNGNRREDIRVQVVPEERISPEDLGRLKVRNNRGELIPLAQLVTVKSMPSPKAIHHEDRVRSIGVFANVAPKSAQGEAIEAVQAAIRPLLPEGYRIDMSGNSKEMGQAFQGLLFALILGIIVAYMILGSQFNSFVHPIVVLVALPFSLSGAILALLAMGQTINVYSFIGVILLMGIVKKNSILMVDFTNQLREKGEPIRDALVEACPSRLRPILMTSVSTIAAAIPAALSLGPGAESRIPMAVVVIGGITVSTILTLFVVPAFYSLASREKAKRLSMREAAA
jgi:hydrophobe/amphiphile efflux-1 (HAE1) family protein